MGIEKRDARRECRTRADHEHHLGNSQGSSIHGAFQEVSKAQETLYANLVLQTDRQHSWTPSQAPTAFITFHTRSGNEKVYLAFTAVARYGRASTGATSASPASPSAEPGIRLGSWSYG